LKGLLIAVLMVFACTPAPESGPAPSTAPETAVAPQAEVPLTDTAPGTVVPVEEKNITIGKVEIANPLVVSGTARTFENNVVLRARAADGSLITETFTTATGEMGQHSPYRGTLWLTRDPGARVIVEALEYSARDGSETNLVRTDKPFDLAPVGAVLYFADESCTAVKPYTRRIPKTVSMARVLVEALVAGPTADEKKRGAAVSFPEGSRVQSVILRNGAITVDFNERLQNVGGSCRTQMIRDSVTETLLRLPAVKKVTITAGGSEELALQP
jgi:Sporulation and spore germination/Immunoglobulin-like domain of bacterial spore germination